MHIGQRFCRTRVGRPLGWCLLGLVRARLSQDAAPSRSFQTSTNPSQLPQDRHYCRYSRGAQVHDRMSFHLVACCTVPITATTSPTEPVQTIVFVHNYTYTIMYPNELVVTLAPGRPCCAGRHPAWTGGRNNGFVISGPMLMLGALCAMSTVLCLGTDFGAASTWAGWGVSHRQVYV